MEINFKKYLNMTFRLEKVEDTKFEGNHPNGFNTGFRIEQAKINIEDSLHYGALFVLSSIQPYIKPYLIYC